MGASAPLCHGEPPVGELSALCSLLLWVLLGRGEGRREDEVSAGGGEAGTGLGRKEGEAVCTRPMPVRGWGRDGGGSQPTRVMLGGGASFSRWF